MTETNLMNTGSRNVWVEQYRPNSLDDVVGHDDVIRKLKHYVQKSEVPNLMFAGPAGVGKTASAIAIAKELYGNEWGEFFLELNASDDRGIDIVRERIKDYASTSMATDFQRIIFLDESDSLTDQAQAALRRTMERYTDQIIFIFSCNYPRKIIPAIQSRCTRFHFGPIDDEIIKKRLSKVANAENVTITEDALDAIAFIADGDMRMAIQALQSVSVLEDEVNEDTVYTIMSHARPEEIEELILLAGSGQFEESLDKLEELMYERGISSGIILDTMHDIIWDLKIRDELIVRMANHIGEIDYRISQGANEHIQMPALLSEFTLMARGEK